MKGSHAVSPEEFLPLLGDWPLAVGQFVMAFSSCEYWTYRYLQQLGSANDQTEMVKAPLSRRINRVRKLGEERILRAEVLTRLDLALNTLSELGKHRNLAAHNAPMAHVYENPVTGEYSVKVEFRGAHNFDAQVTREKLDSWFRDCVFLVNDLSTLAIEISRELDLAASPSP